MSRLEVSSGEGALRSGTADGTERLITFAERAAPLWSTKRLLSSSFSIIFYLISSRDATCAMSKE